MAAAMPPPQHQRQLQESAAAAVLQGALVYLNRGGVIKEPFSPSAFAKHSLKELQAALYLLHHRISGAARTRKELQHLYPVLEPGQARDFKAAMQSWIQELGAAGHVLPDTVKYFVTAYQGSNSHRTILMLLDLSILALSSELGEHLPTWLDEGSGQDDMVAEESLHPNTHQASAAAQREMQQRMDEVAATMQRLKQLHAQAASRLAGSHTSAAVATLRTIPSPVPLFLASQAASKRGQLVLELLAKGLPLTAQPQTVHPDSWADLLASDRGGSSRSNTTSQCTPASAQLARRLSNPDQEASNFAAESLAADADVLVVNQVLVRRLEAGTTSLQAMVANGATARRSGLQAVLGDTAALRESLMLSAQQELAAVQVRAEQQAATGSSGASSHWQLLPPGSPPCNPLSEGFAAAQDQAPIGQEAAAAKSGWTIPSCSLVQAVQQSIWQAAVRKDTGSCTCQPHASTHQPPSAGAEAARAAPRIEPSSPLLQHSGDAVEAAGSSCGSALLLQSKPGGKLSSCINLPDKRSKNSTLPDQPSPLAELDGLQRPVVDGIHSPQHDGLPKKWQCESPGMGESCASVSVVGDSHGQRGNGRAAAVGPVNQEPAPGSSHAPRVSSPMLSAAASFSHLQRLQQEQLPAGSRALLLPALHGPQEEACSMLHNAWAANDMLKPGTQFSGDKPAGNSSPSAAQLLFGDDAALPEAAAASTAGWRSSRRRRASVSFTVTPPRRLAENSPPAQERRLQPCQFAPEFEQHASVADGKHQDLLSPWAAENASASFAPSLASLTPFVSSRSVGRRRSAALHTTSSPTAGSQPLQGSGGMQQSAGGEMPDGLLCQPISLDTPTSRFTPPVTRAAAGAPEAEQCSSQRSSMLTPPRSLIDTPDALGSIGRISSAAEPQEVAGCSSSIDALLKRMAAIRR